MASEGSQKNLTVVLKCANKILLSNFLEPPSGGNVFLYFFKDKNEDQTKTDPTAVKKHKLKFGLIPTLVSSQQGPRG